MNRKRILIPHRIIPDDLYVIRDADRQLQSIIEDMASPGYVLVSRQMGKTNLLLNAKRTYQGPEDIFTYIDLSNAFSSEYDCFRNIINRSVDLSNGRLNHLSPKIDDIRARKLPAHLEHLSELRLILKEISGKMVVILDEIDALTRASYSDKIFSQIRSIYFERDSYPELDRLTYILSGVMEPTEIIRDPKISPFNIGQKIFLDDFSFEEHQIFLSKAGLDLSTETSERVFFWTSGNPRMTYDVCSELEKMIINDLSLDAKDVDAVIKSLYLTLFDKAPVDHIRELAEGSKTIRDAITIIRYGRGSELDIGTKTKLYLAGIIGSDFTADQLGLKNKIIDESLSEKWIASIDKRSRDVGAMIIAASMNKEYSSSIDLFVNRDEADENLENPALYHVGASYYYTGEFGRAIEVLAAIDFNFKYERSFYLDNKILLGQSYLENKNEEDAIKVFNHIKELDPDGTFYYLSLITLGRIYLEYEKGSHIRTAIEYYREILSKTRSFLDAFGKGEGNNLLVSVRLYYGTALGKLKEFSAAEKEFNLALESATAQVKPAILLAVRAITVDQEQKLKLLHEILDFIFAEKLLPDLNLDSGSTFSNQTMYAIFSEVHHTLPDRFIELCKYLLTESERIKRSDYGELLISIIVIAISKANRELVFEICEFIISLENTNRFNVDSLHSVFQFLIAGGPAMLDRIPNLGEKYMHFMLSNKKFILTTSDFDIFMSYGDNQIVERNYEAARETISFLYDALEKTSENLKTSKYLIEFLEIKVLYHCEFEDAAKIRSQTLLNQINSLTQQEVLKNPLFKAIDFVKTSLRNFQFRTNLPSVPVVNFADNERVNVRYHSNNKVLKNVKFKKVRYDFMSGRCEIF